MFLTFKSLQDPVGISKSQLGEFHKLFEESSKDTTKKLKNNFRPEQDLNSREVFDVDTSIKKFSNGSLLTNNFNLLIISIIFLKKLWKCFLEDYYLIILLGKMKCKPGYNLICVQDFNKY